MSSPTFKLSLISIGYIISSSLTFKVLNLKILNTISDFKGTTLIPHCVAANKYCLFTLIVNSYVSISK